MTRTAAVAVIGTAVLHGHDGLEDEYGLHISRLVRDTAMTAVRDARLSPCDLGASAGIALGASMVPEVSWRYHRSLATRNGTDRGRGERGTAPLATVADLAARSLLLNGPKVVISTGSAAGAQALCYAIEAIRSGSASTMLVGGADARDVTTLATFGTWQALNDPTAASSPHNLVAFMVLQAADLANARGHTATAFLNGYGLTSDAFHPTIESPAGRGLVRAMRTALTSAGTDLQSVHYVHGHSSTDATAIAAMFQDTRGPHNRGITEYSHGAAGLLGALVTARAIENQTLPPAEATRSLPTSHNGLTESIRIKSALVNSVAFGGVNCSVAICARPHQADPEPAPTTDIVITGAGVVSGLAVGREPYVAALRRGDNGIRPIQSFSTTERESRLGAEPHPDYLAYVESVHAGLLDDFGALAISAAELAWRDAGHHRRSTDRERIGVILTTNSGPVRTIEQLSGVADRGELGQQNPDTVANAATNTAGVYIAVALGLQGPLMAITSGDVSGVIGLGHAADLIAAGQADAMLVVSVDELSATTHAGHEHLGLLSPGPVRPYDRKPSGGLLGSGAAAVVLESADRARSRSARVHGRYLAHAVTAGSAAGDWSAEAWQRAYSVALSKAKITDDTALAVYGGAWGPAGMGAAEAFAIEQTRPPETTQVINLTDRLGHTQSTAGLFALICGLETCTTGWAPTTEAGGSVQSTLDPAYFTSLVAPAACLISTANWGGTYAVMVVTA